MAATRVAPNRFDGRFARPTPGTAARPPAFGDFARDAIRAGRTVSPGRMALVTGFAGANWLTDLLCFAASARAFGLPVGFATLATIYLGAQIIRQIPLTPGGVGLIETGLLAGLASAGAGAAAAAATVLTYRVLSNWLIVPIGGLAWFGLRRPRGRAASRRPTLGAGHAGRRDTLDAADTLRPEGTLGADEMLVGRDVAGKRRAVDRAGVTPPCTRWRTRRGYEFPGRSG